VGIGVEVVIVLRFLGRGVNDEAVRGLGLRRFDFHSVCVVCMCVRGGQQVARDAGKQERTTRRRTERQRGRPSGAGPRGLAAPPFRLARSVFSFFSARSLQLCQGRVLAVGCFVLLMESPARITTKLA
jgi:hypothetical protein